jgi:spore coat polysaccharide biosynthesis predicted glycosyltransferase SpsG
MPGNKIRIIFRTDGNSKIGMGHLVRCLNLAQELERRSDSDISFLTEDSNEAIEMISRYGYRIKNSLEKESLDAIITSLPEISQDYVQELKKKARLLVCLDDSMTRKFSADIVVRGSIVPELRDYDPGSRARFFAGKEFMILNRQFKKFNMKNKKISPVAKAVLITMGGGDINNLTSKVMAALEGLKDIKKTVVVGPAFKDVHNLKSFKNYTLKYDVSNMAELMFFSDLVIAGGGITLYELASVGVPGIVLCQTEYQLLEANCFEKEGVIVNLGIGNDVSEDTIRANVDRLLKDHVKRKRMSLAGKGLIDGKAIERVTEEILGAL